MAVNPRNKMPSQFPALRLTVARQMEGYQQRLAEKMRAEAAKRGESPVDLASALGTSASTTERWFRGERVPQQRYRRDLRKHWDLEPDFFEVDLEAEEKEVREQLNRIEQKLDRVLKRMEELEAEQAESEVAAALDEDQEPRRDAQQDG